MSGFYLLMSHPETDERIVLDIDEKAKTKKPKRKKEEKIEELNFNDGEENV